MVRHLPSVFACGVRRCILLRPLFLIRKDDTGLQASQ